MSKGAGGSFKDQRWLCQGCASSWRNTASKAHSFGFKRQKWRSADVPGHPRSRGGVRSGQALASAGGRQMFAMGMGKRGGQYDRMRR